MAGISDGPFFIEGAFLSPVLYFIVYCLPDGLWYASLLLLLKALSSYDLFSFATYVLGVASPFILEILQYARIIPGTFDLFDIITYVITLIIINMKSIKRFLQCLSLVAFVAIALACASQKAIVSPAAGMMEAIGGGSNGSDGHSDGSQNIEAPDSISTPDNDYALAN